jgi:hypothetical protein
VPLRKPREGEPIDCFFRTAPGRKMSRAPDGPDVCWSPHRERSLPGRGDGLFHLLGPACAMPPVDLHGPNLPPSGGERPAGRWIAVGLNLNLRPDDSVAGPSKLRLESCSLLKYRIRVVGSRLVVFCGNHHHAENCSTLRARPAGFVVRAPSAIARPGQSPSVRRAERPSVRNVESCQGVSTVIYGM